MNRTMEIRALDRGSRMGSWFASARTGLSTLPVVHSHFVSSDAPRHPTNLMLQLTSCGCYVYAPERHSDTPSCPDCTPTADLRGER